MHGLVNRACTDDVTHRLVGLAMEEPGRSADRIVETSGADWITPMAAEGSVQLLESTGEILPEGFDQLDHRHARAALSFPGPPPPICLCDHSSHASRQQEFRAGRHGRLSSQAHADPVSPVHGERHP